MSLYKAKYVVPGTSSPIQNGAVVFSDDLIKGVGAFEDMVRDYPDEEIQDFGNAAIIPGLVNCHAHLELTAFRGKLDNFDHDFLSWLVEITRLRRENDSDESIRMSALIGACEAAAAGVTLVGDIGRYGFAGTAALNETGLRGIVFQETEFSPDDRTSESDFDVLQRKYEELADGQTGIVSTGISPHAPYTVSRALFKQIAAYAVKNEIPVSIHAAESSAEMEMMMSGEGIFAAAFLKDDVAWQTPGMTTIEYLYEIEVLDTSPLLAHCIHVTEKEISLIEQTGSRIAHCPKSNAKFGHGIAPLRSFMDAGVSVGLGSDSMASNNTCDLFEEARFAGLSSRVASSEGVYAPEDLFELMTMGGAKAMGLDSLVGSLERGKQADLAIIKLDGAGQLPVNDVYSTLVFSTSAASVTRTVVAGEIVYDNGRFKNVDFADVVKRAAGLFSF